MKKNFKKLVLNKSTLANLERSKIVAGGLPTLETSVIWTCNCKILNEPAPSPGPVTATCTQLVCSYVPYCYDTITDGRGNCHPAHDC